MTAIVTNAPSTSPPAPATLPGRTERAPGSAATCRECPAPAKTRGNPFRVSVWIVQVFLAGLLGLGAAFVSSHGGPAVIILGVSGTVLVASSVLVVVWSDSDGRWPTAR